MSDHTSLLHNMSAPPKSVVSYEGLSSGFTIKKLPDGSGHVTNHHSDASLFGTPIRFSLPVGWIGLKPIKILALLNIDLDEGSYDDPSKQLATLINKRAEELSLPEGCAVIATEPSHPILWSDPLATLAITSKCTDTVWLRSKTPSIIAAVQRESISLLVPPRFAIKLPEAKC